MPKLRYLPIQLAVRNRLLTVVVSDTGTVPLAAVAQGYTRVSGSFLTDGFRVGMEVTPEGFAQTEAGIITFVDDKRMDIRGGRIEEANASGRRLFVGIPERRAWENVAFDPEDGRWYIDEDFIAGPVTSVTLGIPAELDIEPTYVLKLYGIAGTGVGALSEVADAVLERFFPRTSFLTTTGQAVYVRGRPAPFKGQLLQHGAGHAVVTITIPLWAHVVTTIEPE